MHDCQSGEAGEGGMWGGRELRLWGWWSMGGIRGAGSHCVLRESEDSQRVVPF